MQFKASGLFAIFGTLCVAASQFPQNNSSEDVNVRWIGEKPAYLAGATFGIPWARGKFDPQKTSFTASTCSGSVDLQSWVIGYWPDGSIKWSAHAVPASDKIPSGYKVTASGAQVSNASTATLTNNRNKRRALGIATDSGDEIVVDTGKIIVSFPKSGSVLVSSIKTSGGKTVGKNGKLILRSQNDIIDCEDFTFSDRRVEHYEFEGVISNATVEDGSSRALVTLSGTHQVQAGSSSSHDPWLPFIVRFYLYKGSEAMRIMHSITYNGNHTTDFISGLGIRFDVPLSRELLYDRHVRIAGTEGGLLNEAVQGITGLRRDPGASVRSAQINGEKTPDATTWDQRVTTRLQWIPTWNDYRLTQLSADGFNLQKRTKQGQSWVKIPGAARSGGLAYLGGATVGGLAFGLRDFWKRYPTSLDIMNAATDTGSITIWLYSPSAPPMDLRPYHDGMGQDTYPKQLDALEITYEDYEPGYDTPFGIARTNELYVYGFDKTPSSERLDSLVRHTNEPPALLVDTNHIKESATLGKWWASPSDTNDSGPAAQTIESHLEFLPEYYRGQVEDRRFYGFWDHGDFMHSYDSDRHTWRYDVGGYAWDNSELSPDIFFWGQLLRTGDSALYRFAEAQVRHGGDVDSYHIGLMKGLGTRHGVQHWGDSAKQARISTPVYRRVFYWISGGDERTGEVIFDTLAVEQAFVNISPGRKIRDPNDTYVPDPAAIGLSFGTDWAGMAMGQLMEWERHGPRWEESRDKLLNQARGIANLKNGFVSGSMLYNSFNGVVSPPYGDPSNNGTIGVSNLGGQFGLFETVTQLVDHFGEATPPGFHEAFLDYCFYYTASAAEQRARYGSSWTVSLRQGFARYTAYAAYISDNATTAARAWREFFASDGIKPTVPWNATLVEGSQVLTPVREAAWFGTNDVGLYGQSAIIGLALIGKWLDANAP
jgi:hypothetical protein